MKEVEFFDSDKRTVEGVHLRTFVSKIRNRGSTGRGSTRGVCAGGVTGGGGRRRPAGAPRPGQAVARGEAGHSRRSAKDFPKGI